MSCLDESFISAHPNRVKFNNFDVKCFMTTQLHTLTSLHGANSHEPFSTILLNGFFSFNHTTKSQLFRFRINTNYKISTAVPFQK